MYTIKCQQRVIFCVIIAQEFIVERRRMQQRVEFGEHHGFVPEHVEHRRVLFKEGIHLALQGRLKHPSGSITDDRVERAPPALHDLADRLRTSVRRPHDPRPRSWTFRTTNRKTSHGGVSFCPNVGRLVG